MQLVIACGGAGREPPQNIDRRLGRNLPGAKRLVEGRNEKRAATGAEQRAHDVLKPEPIGVRLYHARAFGRADDGA